MDKALCGDLYGAVYGEVTVSLRCDYGEYYGVVIVSITV